MAFERTHHRTSPIAAVADKADTSAGESLNRGNADVFAQASGYNLPFIQIDEQRPAHLVLSAGQA